MRFNQLWVFYCLSSSPKLHGDTSCCSIWAPWKNQQILAQNSQVILHHVHPQVRRWISHQLQGNQLGGQLIHPAVDLVWAAWKTNKSFFKIPSLWWHHNADSYGVQYKREEGVRGPVLQECLWAKIASDAPTTLPWWSRSAGYSRRFLAAIAPE